MIVLVLNCGSSSIKYQVIDINEESNALLAKGLVDRIGLPEGTSIIFSIPALPTPIPTHRGGEFPLLHIFSSIGY
jgi:acetate kinase